MPRFLRQFGLRTLLLVCTLAAMSFGLWRWHMTWVDHQYELAQQIADKKGDVRWETWGPAWIHQTFGSRYFSTIVVVDWEHCRLQDDDLKSLEEIPTLEELYIAGNRLTDHGLKVLEKLPRVRKLSLWKTKVTDKGLASVSHLRNLEVVDIKHTKVTNEGLSYLRDLSKLRRLRHSLTLTDVGIDHLAAIPSLVCGQLKCEGLTDVAMRQIRDGIDVEELLLFHPQGDQWAGFLVDHPMLKKLHVVDGKMDDAQLRKLLAPNRLERLGLVTVPVGDAGLIEPQQLSNMQWLQLEGTKVTSAAVLKYFGPYAREISIYGQGAKNQAQIKFNRPSIGPGVDWKGDFAAGDWKWVAELNQAEFFTMQSASGARGIFHGAQRVMQEMKGGPKVAIDDESLRIIAKLPALKYLYISGVQRFTPGGLQALSEAKQLESLTITSAGLTDDYVGKLGELTTLKSLDLSGNSFTSQGMKPLASLKNLTELRLSLCLKLDSEAGLTIRQMTNLKLLEGSMLPIGDEGLKHLHGMPLLKTVGVEGPRVTREGLQKLRDSLPSLNGGPPVK